ncbi:hypothetical protein COW36_02110 [bacterium (Candidatus Blackallbacteria) CG17_big_fil_post_rev_8_21_14_2_50_48_46]|uniref:NlpE C-terminal OB domain-containing protein n=1 Tax=bacterium (Candidatus Blackallbacteria) CG17_big_fil_post_rev_8_21_14_2_50_48_46 TaxID=2014261 RepID=A0A2M7GBC1_9BACT|nr:MAG: hypothetical protein COW64_26500 [bacterium (Candidatus Blackallbacteria) CG18_big_fil_WC_8_21_14_2_50_49_26]PIW19228.1 MAG: hypothetical protein COW36_02110 [bacterium (Candidatus Blackallbacteria) CG17_big_fil_post_rev_8_21_14_2_50_48_46]PIW45422.1 MAG: hypothetical protein COW20_20030 [bacterium (Candidatus Blackallbacteria) CG13_big_fil_rev_8_21_14_2_50_49_14]
MKKPGIFFGLFALLFLSACPPQQDSTHSPDTDPNASSQASTASSPQDSSGLPLIKNSSKPQQASLPAVKTYRGIFLSGEGLQYFKACGSKEELWVEDPEGVLMKRHAALQGLIDLEPVYLEFKARELALTSGDGFASGYRKALRVDSVLTIQNWVSDGRCFPTDFIATGHRPEWSLQILKHNQVYFKSLEGEFPVVESMNWQAPVIEGNQWKYTFRYRSAESETLQATFRKEPCQDGGQTLDFKVQLLFRGINYEGCARQL